MAAAFEDDDVIGDFEAEKSAVEEREKPKDLDLTLQGWGSWTGPGIASKKKDRRAFNVFDLMLERLLEYWGRELVPRHACVLAFELMLRYSSLVILKDFVERIRKRVGFLCKFVYLQLKDGGPFISIFSFTLHPLDILSSCLVGSRLRAL